MGYYNTQASWNKLVAQVQQLSPNLSDESDSDMNGYFGLPTSSSVTGATSTGFPMDDETMFEAGHSDLVPWTQLAAVMDTSGWAMNGVISSAAAQIDNLLPGMSEDDSSSSRSTHSSCGSSSPSSSSHLPTGHQLASLVSAIQNQLAKLEQGPWSTDTNCSLDDYPVGTIVELSQQFSAIAGPVMRNAGRLGELRAGSSNEGSGDEESSSENSSEGRPATEAECSTILLVICGYMWLARIYNVVLGHFHTHLSRMPSDGHLGGGGSVPAVNMVVSGNGSVMGGDSGPALRLGQLSYAGTALSLQQIHTAVRMLLDVLHEIEGHLGTGAVVARDVAVSMLLSSTRRQEGHAGGLLEKATAVKWLLREKMGL